MIGAVGGNRTPDLTLTKRLLYQLSYNGLKRLTPTADAHFITSPALLAAMICTHGIGHGCKAIRTQTGGQFALDALHQRGPVKH